MTNSIYPDERAAEHTRALLAQEAARHARHWPERFERVADVAIDQVAETTPVPTDNPDV